MGKKKVAPEQESFISSTEEVKEELAADVAAETEGTDGGGLAEGDPAEGPEGGEPPCDDCEANLTDCSRNPEDKQDCADALASEDPAPYVTPEPDKISSTFPRNLPVPVPAEELAEYAKEQARLYGVREKALQDKKASNAGFTRLIKDTEAALLKVSHVVEEGTEERPVICRWEFDYRAGIKKLRRLDSWQIVSEETLQGEELHMSFNFNGSSEKAVEKLAEAQGGAGDAPLTDDPNEAQAATEPADRPYRPSNGDEGEFFMGRFCYRCKKDQKAEDDPAQGCPIFVLTIAHNVDDPEYPKEWVENSRDGARCTAFTDLDAPDVPKTDRDTLDLFPEAKDATEAPPVSNEPEKPKGPHACKLCGFDGGSHVYLVRHLRDAHDLKLSDYKKQFPAEK